VDQDQQEDQDRQDLQVLEDQLVPMVNLVQMVNKGLQVHRDQPDQQGHLEWLDLRVKQGSLDLKGRLVLRDPLDKMELRVSLVVRDQLVPVDQ